MSEINFTTRVLVNKPDRNGMIIPEEVMAKACKRASNIPLVFRTEEGVRIPIGNVGLEYDNGVLRVSGVTSEDKDHE